MSKFYRSDLESLSRNPVWQELKENAAELLVGLQDDLEHLEPIAQGIQMARVQGKMEVIRTIFDGWLDDIKQDIIEQEEESRNGT